MIVKEIIKGTKRVVCDNCFYEFDNTEIVITRLCEDGILRNLCTDCSKFVEYQ